MAAKSDKVIITCAITGAIHTPTMSDALPITRDQSGEQAIAGAEAGASILHLHARNPEDGRPTGDPAMFMQFLPRIKQATDSVINITTGGSPTMPVEERLAGVMKLSPEMCSLNMGSMNFGLYPMVARYKSWKHDWEKPYLLGTNETIFRNTFADIEKISKLFGDDYQWSVLGAGRFQMPFATQAVMLGGNVRVGLEDSLFIGRGKLAKSNAEQVAKVRRLIEEVGYQVATAKEARETLGLKGPDRTTF